MHVVPAAHIPGALSVEIYTGSGAEPLLYGPGRAFAEKHGTTTLTHSFHHIVHLQKKHLHIILSDQKQAS